MAIELLDAPKTKSEPIETTAVTVERKTTEIVTKSGRIDFELIVADLKTESSEAMKTKPITLGDTTGYEAVKRLKNDWMKYRTKTEGVRTEFNRAIRKQIEDDIRTANEAAAELTEVIVPTEEYLKTLLHNHDTAVVNAEREKRDKFFNARNSQLSHVGIELQRVVIESLADADIAKMIDDKVESDRLRKAEAERLAAEKAESDRIAAEQAEANRKEAEKLAADRAEFEKQQAAAKAETDRLAKIEADKLAEQHAELDRQKAEQDAAAQVVRAQQEAAQKKIDDDAAALEKLNQERLDKALAERNAIEQAERDRKESDEKLKRDTEEARLKAEQDEADRVRAEKLRPDREKLLAFCDSVSELDIPDVSAESRFVRSLIVAGLKDAAADLRGIVESRME